MSTTTPNKINNKNMRCINNAPKKEAPSELKKTFITNPKSKTPILSKLDKIKTLSLELGNQIDRFQDYVDYTLSLHIKPGTKPTTITIYKKGTHYFEKLDNVPTPKMCSFCKKMNIEYICVKCVNNICENCLNQSLTISDCDPAKKRKNGKI